MTKKNFTIKSAFIIFFGFLFAFILTFLLFSIFQQGKFEDDSLVLDDQWNLRINDTPYSNVSLSETLFPEVNTGDIVTFSRTLPDAGLEHAQLIFFSCHSTVNVWLNGVPLYSFGEEHYEKHQMIGYGNHYVELPISYVGKTITIQMKVSEKHAFTSLTCPMISDGYNSKNLFMRKQIIPFFIGIFLLIFGIAFLFLSIVMFSISGEFFPLLQISFISICIGMWTFCNYHLMQLFTPDLSLCAYLEYGSLYLVPIPVMLYFNSCLKTAKIHLLSMLYRIFLIVYSLFVVTSFTSQILNFIHFPGFLRVFHILSVLMLLLIIITPFMNMEKQTLESKLLICGLVIFALFATFDLVRFNLEKYTRFFLRESFNGLLPIGAVIFILFLSVSFCIQLTQSYYSKARQDLLEYQAHTDSMTGLANRRSCEEELLRYKAFPSNQIYGILSFDLNNLKQTNDSLGHEYGDKLIITFSRLLKEVFQNHGVIGRMGGDEFIVLIPNIQTCDIDALLNELQVQISITNQELTEFTISTSYGYANSTESSDILEIYQLADRRMYDYKRRYKGKSTEPELFPGL